MSFDIERLLKLQHKLTRYDAIHEVQKIFNEINEKHYILPDGLEDKIVSAIMNLKQSTPEGFTNE
jgi:hypothetical protein